MHTVASTAAQEHMPAMALAARGPMRARRRRHGRATMCPQVPALLDLVAWRRWQCARSSARASRNAGREVTSCFTFLC